MSFGMEVDMEEERERTGEGGEKKKSLRELGAKKLILIGVLGILLLLLSVPEFLHFGEKEASSAKTGLESMASGTAGETGTQNAAEVGADYKAQMEAELTEALEGVEGIGKVKVMITLKESEEKVVLKDTPYTQENTNQETNTSSNISKEEETVLVEGEEGGKMPYVTKETGPVAEGILVIAKGGGDLKIQGEIISAVEVLFDVPAHKIKVMKMKQ